jgi:hypothetical protein
LYYGISNDDTSVKSGSIGNKLFYNATQHILTKGLYMNMYYTGIGARKTPYDILTEMTVLGSILADANFTLRSGGAVGADSAFEAGCQKVNGMADIFIPWKGFQHHSSTLYPPTTAALDIAAVLHPAWHKCSSWARMLHARNVHQVMGYNIDTPSRFVICWTPGGELTGGTALAIRVAMKFNIPVFNLQDRDDKASLAQLLLHNAVEYAVNHGEQHV